VLTDPARVAESRPRYPAVRRARAASVPRGVTRGP
jgi:hypothetical protein